MTDDEFPDPETELAFLDFLATEWPNWRHHVGSDYWHIRRRSFLAGRPAPQALAATPAVGGEITDVMLNAAAIEWTRMCHGYPYSNEGVEWSEFFGRMFKAAVAAQPASQPAVGGEGMVLHPLSEIREWDEALAVLGIQDSDQTPADAIRELNHEIERLRSRTTALDPADAVYYEGYEQARSDLAPPAAQPASPLRGASYDRIANVLIDDGYSTFAVKDWIYLLNKSGLVICEASASSPERPEFQRTNPLDIRLSPIPPFTGNYKDTKE